VQALTVPLTMEQKLLKYRQKMYCRAIREAEEAKVKMD
jgi:hypothetical protein